MKLLFWLIVGLALGFAAQRLNRDDVVGLEAQATEAWNRKDLSAAELLARRALGRDSGATRAREILSQLGQVLERPEIALALARDDLRNSRHPDLALAEVGRISLSNHLFRLADAAFEDAITRFPDNTALRRQFVALSGLRLDAEQMQSRLLTWAEHGQPTADLVLMSLGLWSIESRGAEPSEVWLRAAVEADQTDLASRAGLARCLLAMGRYRECEQILDGYREHPDLALLLALVYATTKDVARAEPLLPASEPTSLRGEYWFTKGLIAAGKGDYPAAEAAFEQAVRFQPLNKTFRSRYVDLIRRRDQTSERSQQIRELETVLRIVQRAMQSQRTGETVSLADLAEMCRSVGASDAARLLDHASRP